MRFAIITVSEGKRWGHLWCHIAIQVCLRGSRPTAENGKSLALRESETSSRLSWEDIWQNESWIISFLICLNHCIVYPERNQYLWWLFGESLLNRRFFSNYLSVCVCVFLQYTGKFEFTIAGIQCSTTLCHNMPGSSELDWRRCSTRLPFWAPLMRNIVNVNHNV